MPSLNRNKKFVKGAAYHIYNRGVNKTSIFYGPKDYEKFIDILRSYLAPKEIIIQEKALQVAAKGSNNRELFSFMEMRSFSESMDLVSYCLMPNHFHLLIYQTEATDITEFMRGLSTRYVKYFNSKYDRVGGLFQDIYKARLITDDQDLLDTSRYIHRNPKDLRAHIAKYPWSNFKDYVSGTKQDWTDTEAVLKAFDKSAYHRSLNSYPAFVNDDH